MKLPYLLVAQNVDVAASNKIVSVEDVDWPLMGVKALEQFAGGVDYSGEAHMETAV